LLSGEIVKLEKIILWNWRVEEKKQAWIKWENIYTNKVKGGLGIKDIENFNLTPVTK